MKNVTFDLDFQNDDFELEEFTKWEFANREIFRYYAFFPDNEMDLIYESPDVFGKDELIIIKKLRKIWKNYIYKVCDKTFTIDDYIVSAWTNLNDEIQKPVINYAGKLVNWNKDLKKAKEGYTIIECEGEKISVNIVSCKIISRNLYEKILDYHDLTCDDLKLPKPLFFN